MSFGHLRRLDDHVDQGLKKRGLPGLFGEETLAGTARSGRAGKGRRLLLRTGTDASVLITWGAYLVVLAILSLGTIGYVIGVEGRGHSPVVPVVVLLVVGLTFGFVFQSYGPGSGSDK